MDYLLCDILYDSISAFLRSNGNYASYVVFSVNLFESFLLDHSFNAPCDSSSFVYTSFFHIEN